MRAGQRDAGREELRCAGALVRVFEILGKRWNGVILATLKSGPASFSEVARSVAGISDSVLSDRLSELVRVGLVIRTVVDARPPAVSYGLTPAGDALVLVLDELAGWADEHLPDA
ncbi:winged helix-turn-helix transcriptional regulator [Polymorphospora rubra]|uniref:HTH hxlR-type domain-containing protein n=1 Tax=Polymorphospora rubra TaxID=338584 RepID=A0A810MT85_9ACTN|nr:helix-turn-helix domain-containing protein [Polymorphospora rubra]BCJ64261.1 hypothetical protein Prubr_12820 [Polymorphospora rubra]